MFRVKICGITSVEDALAAAAAGADAIGLNCYPQSPRYCPPEIAAKIARAVPRQVCKVGVFVGATAAEIRGTVEALGLDLVQLHGDEPPALMAALRGLAVMKAFRIADDYSIVADYLRGCHQLACLPRMVLVDALRSGQFGGTGETLDWPKLSAERPRFAGVPLVLAGGLNASNVADAIAAVRPWAVDTASGMEVSPGRKSPELMRDFVAAAQAAFWQPDGWKSGKAAT